MNTTILLNLDYIFCELLNQFLIHKGIKTAQLKSYNMHRHLVLDLLTKKTMKTSPSIFFIVAQTCIPDKKCHLQEE